MYLLMLKLYSSCGHKQILFFPLSSFILPKCPLAVPLFLLSTLSLSSTCICYRHPISLSLPDFLFLSSSVTLYFYLQCSVLHFTVCPDSSVSLGHSNSSTFTLWGNGHINLKVSYSVSESILFLLCFFQVQCRWEVPGRKKHYKNVIQI